MKLIGRLKKLESAVQGEVRVRAAGIAWTEDHEHYGGPLREGQRVVTDVHVKEHLNDTPVWTLRDRPARDPEDLGDVFGPGGELLGRVERVEGSLVVYREVPSPSGVRNTSK